MKGKLSHHLNRYRNPASIHNDETHIIPTPEENTAMHCRAKIYFAVSFSMHKIYFGLFPNSLLLGVIKS